MTKLNPLITKPLAAALFATCVAATLPTEAPALPQRHILASAALGGGHVTVWETAMGLGASIDDAAVTALPDQETQIDLPLKGAAPFQFVELDWHPHGHPPKGMYDVPHFDLHFYVIDKATRDAIVPGPTAAAKPRVAELPAGYVTDGEVVPHMGVHYVPASTPELHGQPFTITPIYGYDSGRLAFIEPMVTLDFLKSTSSWETRIAQPQHFSVHGRFPQVLRVAHDASEKRYEILLTGMRSV